MKPQKKYPTISIVLPALNSEKTVEHAILSMIWQTFEDWELLLMDDGSSDRTVEIARQFKDSRIHVLVDRTHRGLPARLNQAVRMARGKYLARMDADDIAYPHRLQKQIDFLESHPEVDVVGGAVIVFRTGGSATGLRRFGATHAEICARPWALIPVTHPTWMGRISWFRHNPYREDATRMEDQELLRRTYSQSCFANMPEVLLGFREDSISLAKQMTARKNLCKFGIQAAKHDKDFLMATRVIAAQLPRIAVDILAVGSGMGLRLLRYRAPKASPREIEEWNQIWTAISSVHPPIQSAASGSV